MKTNKNGHTAQLTPSASTTKNVGQPGTKQSYRYPGAQPFSTSQANIFFGREQDALDLFHLIKLEPLVVVHARSGLGKSSLLNAGIIPHIVEEGEYTPITIRFGAYRQENGQNLPLNITRSRVGEHLHSAEASFLDELLENDGSLWYMFAREHTFDLGRRKFLLIFDQFEELTTYPETAVHSFKTQLAELFYSQIPERFRQPVEMEVASPKILTRSQLSLLHEPLQLKIVLAIRSDRISLLDQLSTHLPLVKRSWFELGSLTEQQAEEAILSPAYKAGSFLSPIFDFEDEAIEAMLSFLTKGHSENIESFQLQILCQSIEQKVIQQGLKMVTLADLGNIQEVYENYYEDRIRSLGSMEDQNAARQFIEDGLIFEEEERRLSLYEGQIHSTFGISDELLRRLVDTHLIRREPSAKGGYLYELSHDTLVAPVLKAKAVRVAEEERKAAKLERLKWEQERQAEFLQMQLQQKVETQRRRYWVLGVFTTLLLVVSAMAVWGWVDSNKQAEKAYEQTEIAEKQTELAKKQKETADSLRRIVSKQLTEVEEAKWVSDSLGIESFFNWKEAERQRDSANQRGSEKILANKKLQYANSQLAEKNDSIEAQKNIALQNAIELSNEKSKVVQANHFNRSKSIAFQSVQMNPLNYREKALLALEAHRIYQDSSGVFYQKYQPEIFKALYDSWASLPDFRDSNRARTGRQIDQLVTDNKQEHFFTMGKVGAFAGWKLSNYSVALQNVASKVSEVQNSMALSPDGRWLAVGGKSPALMIFDLQRSPSNRFSPIILNLGNISEVYQIQFHPGTEWAFISTNDNWIHALHLYDGNRDRDRDYSLKTVARVEALAVSSNMIVAGDLAGNLYFQSISDFDPEKKKPDIKCEGKITSLAIFESNDSFTVAFGNENGLIEIWKWGANGISKIKGPHALNQHSARIASLTFDQSGNKLAAASYDGTASVTFLEQTDWPVYIFDDVGDWATSVTFLSDDNNQLMVSSKKGDLIFYELEMTFYQDLLKEITQQWKSNKTTSLK
ncbi:MAG: hypothetical protein R2825_18085 [Saprospiraceae bacterium]